MSTKVLVRRLATTGVLALLAFLATAESATAQPPLGCGYCQNGEVEGEDAHQFMSWLGSIRECDPFDCHNYPVIDFCEAWHTSCPPTEDLEEDLLAAMGTGESGLVMELLKAHPARLQLELDTRSVGILNCDGSLLRVVELPPWVVDFGFLPSTKTVPHSH